MENYIDGTKSFIETIGAKEDEQVVFGWAVFPSKEIRDLANKKVPTDPNKLIFDGSRMAYGGFKPIVQTNESE